MKQRWASEHGDMLSAFEGADIERSAVVVTTNVSKTRKDGSLLPMEKCGTMGAGAAKDAASRWPYVRKYWARMVHGGVTRGCFLTPLMPPKIVSVDLSEWGVRWFGCLVVKTVWWKPADLYLVEYGLQRLREYADGLEMNAVFLNYPGIGNGKLEVREVKPLLNRYLDSRFHVYRK